MRFLPSAPEILFITLSLCTVGSAQEEVRPAEPVSPPELSQPAKEMTPEATAAPAPVQSAEETTPAAPAPAPELSQPAPKITPETAATPALAQSAEDLYHAAIAEIERASKLERKGKKEEAINTYEHAGRVCEESMAAFDRGAIAEGDRPIDLYFRGATSFLHAGRLLASEKHPNEDRKDEDLRLATTYLEKLEKLENERAERNHTAVNPEVWRVQNAAGYACFLRGELSRARTHYQAVLKMNPTYKPAKDAVAKINELERRENEIFSPQGRTLDHEKKMKAVGGVVDTLKLVRDIVKLGL